MFGSILFRRPKPHGLGEFRLQSSRAASFSRGPVASRWHNLRLGLPKMGCMFLVSISLRRPTQIDLSAGTFKGLRRRICLTVVSCRTMDPLDRPSLEAKSCGCHPCQASRYPTIGSKYIAKRVIVPFPFFSLREHMFRSSTFPFMKRQLFQ